MTENKKNVFEYTYISKCLIITIETYGAYHPQGINLDKQFGKKIQDATGEKLSTFYLPIPKHIDGTTKRQCGLCYGLPKRYCISANSLRP